MNSEIDILASLHGSWTSFGAQLMFIFSYLLTFKNTRYRVSLKAPSSIDDKLELQHCGFAAVCSTIETNILYSSMQSLLPQAAATNVQSIYTEEKTK